MNPKNIIAILILLISGMFPYFFVIPFKNAVVDPVVTHVETLNEAYLQATEQLALKALRIKKQQLDEEQINFLKTFIPERLQSGRLVYNLLQLANQRRLTVKGVQYSILSDPLKKNYENKLSIEITLEGNYEDFETWLKTIERSDVLLDVESVRGSKNSNNSNIITFYVKIYAYGVTID